jgi:hypothetical protein
MVALSGCLMLVAIGLMAAPPAAQATPHVACAGGSWTVDFSPALTQTNQSVTLTYSASYLCELGQSSATGSFETTETVGCNLSSVLESLGKLDEVIDWASTGSSTVDYTNFTSVSLAATSTGTVTSGDYNGDVVTRTNSIIVDDDLVACFAGLGTLERLSGNNDLLTVSN